MDKEMKIELTNNGEEYLQIREYDQSGDEYKDYTLERFESLSFECEKLTHTYRYVCKNEKVKNHIETSGFTRNESEDFYKITKFVGKEFIIEGRNFKEEEENKKIEEIISGDITLKSKLQSYSKLSFSPFLEEYSVKKFRVYFRKRQKKEYEDEKGKSVEIRYNRNPLGVHLIQIIILLTDDEFEKIHNLIRLSKSHILKGELWEIYGIYYDENSFGEEEFTYKFLENYNVLDKLNYEKYLPPTLGPVGSVIYNLETF
jgi:hypothetical protein